MNFGNSAFWRSRLTKCSRGWRPFALLTALALALCLPGLFTLPLTGAGEGAAAQIARQSARNGVSLQLTFQDHAVSPRPQGGIWLQALTAQALGAVGSVWPYRIASALSLLAGALFVFIGGRALFTPERGLLAALLFLITPVSLLAGQSAFSAALTTALITLNITALILTQRHNSRRPGELPAWMVALFWLSAGAGVLVSGLLPLLTTVGVVAAIRYKDRSFRSLRGLCPLWGPLCAVLPALPWGFALREAWRNPPQGADLARLLLGGDYVPWSLPGGNLLPLLLLLWPALFFLVQAGYLLRRKRTRQAMLCAGWVLPPALLAVVLPFSAPLLMLPALPGLCLLCADFVLSPERMPANRVLRGFVWAACLAGALGPLAALALVVIAAAFMQPQPVMQILLPALALLFAAAACWYIRKGARLRLCLISLVFCLILTPLFSAVFLPALKTSWLPIQVSKEYARFYDNALRAVPAYGDTSYAPPRLVCLGLNSPEIIFYTGAQTMLSSSPAEAADQILTCPGDCLAVHEDDHTAVLQELQLRRLVTSPAGLVRGFDPARGRVATVYFYQNAAPADASRYMPEVVPEDAWGGWNGTGAENESVPPARGLVPQEERP